MAQKRSTCETDEERENEMPQSKLSLDYAPMEAELKNALPPGDKWMFEPKWDGFRCIAHKDGDDINLISKSGQQLGRYFPEVVETLQKLPAKHFVVDGELVVPEGNSFSFDNLLQRIHPAQSRVLKLSKETPALYILFDLLVTDEDELIVDRPFSERRKELEGFAERVLKDLKTIIITPVTTDREVADGWFTRVSEFNDGVIAKRSDLSYQSGNRKGMIKVKRQRTADCVIGGFRFATGSSKEIGSLLLGLYDEEGELHHVGFTSGFASVDKKKLCAELLELQTDSSFTANIPGAPSRWSTERSTKWQPVKPEIVVEVRFDHLTGGRFRHGTKLLRLRPDKKPKQCDFAQLGSKT
jgi:ATP-dependent DNA ligase